MKPTRPARSARNRSASRTVLALLCSLCLASVAACGGDDEAEEALRRQPTLAPPSTAAPLPTETGDADDQDAATDDDSDAGEEPGDASDGADDDSGDSDADGGPAERVVELPADGATPVIQIARIENRPWEPLLLAQMTPHLSIQADGYAVFASPYGTSQIGWYQTALSPDDVLSFARLLVSEIGVLDMQGLEDDELTFATEPDGSPSDCDAYGIIAVRTAADQGRLIISECELETPTGADVEAKERLFDVVNTIENWKRVVDHSGVSPEQQIAFRQLMGWYSGVRQPYTPESAVAFGTRARGSIPAGASISGWPLDIPLSESFDADFGQDPVEVVLSGADVQRGLQSSLAFALEQPRSYWGPLYMAEDRVLHSVGFRAAVPGANYVVVDYDYVPPRRGIGVGR